MRKSDFCIKMQVEEETEGVTFWVIFVHASTDARNRRRQWEYLIDIKQHWGSK